MKSMDALQRKILFRCACLEMKSSTIKVKTKWLKQFLSITSKSELKVPQSDIDEMSAKYEVEKLLSVFKYFECLTMSGVM